MATTWADVADSALKIGLGGFVTYIVTRYQHTSQRERDRLTRRDDLLEKVAAEFEANWAITSTLMSRMLRASTPTLTRASRNEIIDRLIAAHNPLNVSLALSHLLRAATLNSALDRYKDTMHSMVRHADLHADDFQLETLDDFGKRLNAHRAEVVYALASEYHEEGNGVKTVNRD